MTDKYYRTKPEDLRIGYEYYLLNKENKFNRDNAVNNIVRNLVDIYDMNHMFEEGSELEVYTRKLTGPQIENELKGYTTSPGATYVFLNEDIYVKPSWSTSPIEGVRIQYLNDWLLIQMKRHGVYQKFYEGSCPSINEFRQIIKLLSI